MTPHSLRLRLTPFLLSLLCCCFVGVGAEHLPTVAFKQKPDRLLITIGGKPFASYVYGDNGITRPYFAHVRSPGGIQVTRNHPPIRGQDPTDHATMHPGIWLTFGDISGNDYWRLKARTVHDGFVVQPAGAAGRGSFTVRNCYVSAEGNKTICLERCRYNVVTRPAGYLLTYESTFTSQEGDFYFGDQEEMGLGIRVATPISVREGGQITDSENRRDEKGVWGRQADWCDYSGTVNGKRVGIAIIPAPSNFRRSWYHARDYGLLVANPFGRNAMTNGEKSKVVVRKGEEFRLGYGVFIYSVPAEETVDIAAVCKDYLKNIVTSTTR